MNNMKALAPVDSSWSECEPSSLIMSWRPKRVAALRITVHNGEEV